MNEEKKKKVLTTSVGLASGAISGTAVGIIRNPGEPIEVVEMENQQTVVPNEQPVNEQPVLEVEVNELEQIQTSEQDAGSGTPIEIQPVENPDGQENITISNEPIYPVDDMYGGPVDIDDNLLMYGGPDDYDDIDPSIDDDDEEDAIDDLIDEVLSEDLLSDDL